MGRLLASAMHLYPEALGQSRLGTGKQVGDNRDVARATCGHTDTGSTADPSQRREPAQKAGGGLSTKGMSDNKEMTRPQPPWDNPEGAVGITRSCHWCHETRKAHLPHWGAPLRHLAPLPSHPARFSSWRMATLAGHQGKAEWPWFCRLPLS